MLVAESLGGAVSKADYRKRVSALLPGRSNKAIEFKWCNLSAVLDEAGLPWVPGFKPLSNYQGRLGELAAMWIINHPFLHAVLDAGT